MRPDAGAIGDRVLPCGRRRNAGHSFRENASNKRILPIWPATESKDAAMVRPTSGSQISTAIRSALSRSLVALSSIQSQDDGLPFKGARVVTESGEALGHGHFYSAARIGHSFRGQQIARESSSEEASPYRCPDASTLS